jgi:hypothetical protein
VFTTELAVWREYYEWVVHHGVGLPQVGYDDTLLDLLMGTLSSVLAGLGLAAWSVAGWGTEGLPAHQNTRQRGITKAAGAQDVRSHPTPRRWERPWKARTRVSGTASMSPAASSSAAAMTRKAAPAPTVPLSQPTT